MVQVHPYRSGNYAPIKSEKQLTPCTFEGKIPHELAGGMYIRNGSNPAGPTDDTSPSAAYHWFDGDGMLAGVLFDDFHNTSTITPTFVQKYVLTDVYLASSPTSPRPILPSIATLLAPLSGLPTLLLSISRAVTLSLLSHYNPLAQQAVDRISVGNTTIFYSDGRALVGCESGPLGWVTLPGLDMVGWWDLKGDDGEVGLRERGGTALGWMKEWCTAHPKRDPITGELILFHSSLLPPYLHYSVIPESQYSKATTPRILSAPVPIPGPRMMHDFAASHSHSILLDMPLSLDPLNLLRGIPVVSFSPSTPSRFGVFPRHSPSLVRWYSAPACCIFHSALCYSDEFTANLLCCQMNSSRLVYAAGMLEFPQSQLLPHGVEETCRLYYYQFPLLPSAPSVPTYAFPLSAIPFEFPTTPHEMSMKDAQFVYGCSMTKGSFTAALGKAAKIDCLVKVDVKRLTAMGIKGSHQAEEPVDSRSVQQILENQSERTSEGPEQDLIRVFVCPPNWFAQEASFVQKANPRGEDDGFLLCYMFDESQLDAKTGEADEGCRSELWIVDAWDMKSIVAKVKLPSRGLHGSWFTKEFIASQRDIPQVRQRTSKFDQEEEGRSSGSKNSIWGNVVGRIVKYLD